MGSRIGYFTPFHRARNTMPANSRLYDVSMSIGKNQKA